MLLQAREHQTARKQEEPGQGPVTRSPQQSPEGANPADTLFLDFQRLELWDKTLVLFKPPGLWYIVMAAQQTNMLPLSTKSGENCERCYNIYY